MNTQLEANDILCLEQKYWDAMKNNDVETAVSLTHFPCLVSGPSGTRKISEEQYRKMINMHSAEEYIGVEMAKPEVEFLNDCTAVITYCTEVNGMSMLDVSTWIKEGDKWLCAFHSENPKGKIEQ